MVDSNGSDSKRGASLSRERKGFTVAASPFNAVKLDLAVIVILGLLLALIHDRLVEHPLGQLILLAVFGLASMLWIIFRSRRVSQRLMAEQERGE